MPSLSYAAALLAGVGRSLIPGRPDPSMLTPPGPHCLLRGLVWFGWGGRGGSIGCRVGDVVVAASGGEEVLGHGFAFEAFLYAQKGCQADHGPAEHSCDRIQGGATVKHSQWRTRQTRRLLGEAVAESPAYVEAGYAFTLGQAVYDRRSELGLSQSALARRAEMTQPQISNIEGGDSVPTLPLLTRLAKALDASLTIDLEGDTSVFVFTAHDDRPSDAAPREGRSPAA